MPSENTGAARRSTFARRAGLLAPATLSVWGAPCGFTLGTLVAVKFSDDKRRFGRAMRGTRKTGFLQSAFIR